MSVQRYGFFSTHSELSRRYAKIRPKKTKKSLSVTKIEFSVTKINLPVTKIEIPVTKIEISMTKIKSWFV